MQLTNEFFDGLCREERFRDVLRDLDISEEDQMDLFDTLDVEGAGTIDLMDFIIGIGKLRGEARKADIISMCLMLRSLQQKMGQMTGLATPRSSKRLSCPSPRRSPCPSEQ